MEIILGVLLLISFIIIIAIFLKLKQKESYYISQMKNLITSNEEISKNLEQQKKLFNQKNVELESLEYKKNDISENLLFIASVFDSPPVENDDFKEFKKLLNVDYTQYANENDVLAEEVDMFSKLKNVEKELELVVNCPFLYKKNIIAIAGSFSSGKSSFINSLFETREVSLPTGIQPITAIPAYVLSGSTPSITGYSWKGGKVSITKNIFKKFSHDKLKSFAFNIKTILPYVTINTKLSEDFKHICFIDTPGYNPGTKTKSDMDTSIEYIMKTSALIWIISVELGTLPNDDADLLLKIFEHDKNKKLFVICNKSDLRSDDEVEGVCTEIANQLDILGIPYVGVMPYSSNSRINYDNNNLPIGTVGKSLKSFFEELNYENTSKSNNLIKIVEDVFFKYISADKDLIETLTDYKVMLNKINLKIFSDMKKKEKEVLYYRARVDRTIFNDLVPDTKDEMTHDYDKLLQKIMLDYQKKIEVCEDDMLVAEKISKKMEKCILNIFNKDD